MFPSKKRNIVIPQSEHLKLVGALALLWGNTQFEKPPINNESFLLGAATHDRAFGELDTDVLGSLTEEDRVRQVDTWLDTAFDNHEVALVVLLHVRRLMNTPERIALYERLDERILEITDRHNVDIGSYEKADTITDLCDLVSFDFCFEVDTQGVRKVYKNESEMIDVSYSIQGNQITLDPWPLSVPEYKGYILGYEAEGYPNKLQPVLLDYVINPL